MLPIISGTTRNVVAVTTDSGKKKYAMSYSFRLDTGDMVRKAGAGIQHAAEKGYGEISGFVRRKYKVMKIKRSLNHLRKGLISAAKVELPYKRIRSRIKKLVHA
ncbi:MAG: hypothetical protein Q8916_02270 [Bacteroidota bacterium]|nr:hypothetical protein [Bacteroidota bacterium]MDP4229212.1 hypothetical protein [Bacteroidota bacterium]MDP4235265.1 hypothetical protein [Bacteroidota bacterium]